jgi:iron(III) transport system ATP-binding protein
MTDLLDPTDRTLRPGRQVVSRVQDMTRADAPVALQVRGLRHAYGSVEVLSGVDVDVAARTTLAVLGPSGCGKSTLLRLIAGFERPGAGSVAIAGTEVVGPGTWVPPHRRNMGYVAQEGSLFPHLTVRQNVEFGLQRRARRERRVRELLELVNLEAVYLNRYPHELSGGQQQRVALARALARQPAVVLLDEPFSALDTDLRAATRTAVAAALQAAGVTTVLVTHDQGEALSFADRLAVMRRGRLSQVGPTAEVYETPADAETARLVGAAVFVPGVVRGPYAETPLGSIPLRVPGQDGAATVMVRPEQLAVQPASDGEFEVRAVHYFGHDHVVELAWPAVGLTLHARVPGDVVCRPGDRVHVQVQGPVVAFPASGSAEGLPEETLVRP